MQKDSGRKPENVALGQAIARAREKAGMSQVQLAEQFGLRQQSVADWERGKTAPIGARLQKLFAILPALQSEMGDARADSHRPAPRRRDDWPFPFTRDEWNLVADQVYSSVVDLVEGALKRAASGAGGRRRSRTKS